MPLFENPIALSRTVAELSLALFRHHAALRSGQPSVLGPFVGKPELSRREAFREIREAGLPPTVERAFLGHAFRFADARVNAPFHAALAEAYRFASYPVPWDNSRTFTPRALFFGLLGARGERSRYLSAFADASERLRHLTLELWSRRVELARRACFQHLDAIESPTPSIAKVAESLLVATEDLYRQLVPSSLEGFIEAAHGVTPSSSWPAQLNPRTLEGLLGSGDWLKGLDLRVARLPEPLSPASFCRALARVGAAMVEAAAPTTQPFVIAHDPHGLERYGFGAVLGSLATSTSYCRRRLQESRSQAAATARALTVSQLIFARTQALVVLLRDRICRGPGELTRDYEALCHRAFGRAFPGALAGLLPRLHPYAGQRLLGICESARRTTRLVEQFDEDWFDNPRAIESIRDDLSHVPAVEWPEEQAQASVENYAAELTRRLG